MKEKAVKVILSLKKVKPLKLINKSLMMIFTKRIDTLNMRAIPVMPIGPFKKKKIMSAKQGGFAPNTEYTGSFIDGTFDDLNVSNKSYLKYYKDLLK
jgi:hypothetical protein